MRRSQMRVAATTRAQAATVSPAGLAADRRHPSIAAAPDDVIDALAPEHREELAAVWQNRAGLELQVGAGFAAIARELVEHGAIQPVIELVSGAVRDEVRHAEI